MTDTVSISADISVVTNIGCIGFADMENVLSVSLSVSANRDFHMGS